MVELLAFNFDLNSFCERISAALVSEVFAKASTSTSSENLKVTSPLLLMGEILRVTIFFSVDFVTLLTLEPLINCLLIGSKYNWKPFAGLTQLTSLFSSTRHSTLFIRVSCLSS